MRRLIPWLLCVFAIMGLAEPIWVHFRWDVEEMHDPKQMLVIAINGKAMAPKIQVHQNDSIGVEIRNGLKEELMIQWHGLEKVPKQRKCNGTDQPIPVGQAVTYCLAAKQAGKFSYEAQSKLQIDAGLKGSIVVLYNG